MAATDRAQEEVRNIGVPACSRRRSALGGLLVRKERWGLSWRGWVAVAVLTGTSLAVAFVWLHPFLAVSRPVRGEFLVVEGWVPTYALQQALEEFRSGGYRRLLTTGGPIAEEDRWAEYHTLAEAAAARLRNLGLSAESAEPIASVLVVRNRTYASALGVRRWFLEHGVPVKAINVVTLGAHARRTRLMYEKAFGSQVAIGIISVSNRSYDPRRWWESSEGVKEVILETIGYLYCRFFFHPPSPPAERKRGGDGARPQAAACGLRRIGLDGRLPAVCACGWRVELLAA